MTLGRSISVGILAVAVLVALAPDAMAQRGSGSPRGGGGAGIRGGGGGGGMRGGGGARGMGIQRAGPNGPRGGDWRGGGRDGEWRGGGRGGRWHGDGHRGWHRHGGHHHHGGSTVFFGVGPWWWGGYPYWSYPYWSYPYWSYPYWWEYPAYAYVYPYPARRYPPYPDEDQVYVERPDAAGDRPEGYWYYCESKRGYYPTVPECPEEWIKVPPIAD